MADVNADDFGPDGERIAKAYSSPPWWYQMRGMFIATVSYNTSIFTLLDFYEKHLGDNHLEVAVGDGMFLGLILKTRAWRKRPLPTRIEGLDLSPTMLDGARQNLEGKVPIKLVRGDATKMPYEADRFDSVGLPNAIHTMADPDAVLRDVFRVLKPGGTFKVNALLHPRGPLPLRWAAQRLNEWGIANGMLARTFDQHDFRDRLERAGFAVESEQVHGNDYEVVGRKPAAMS